MVLEAVARAPEDVSTPEETIYIVSTRPPKTPLSGGMAPAVREATQNYRTRIWFALGSESEKTQMRIAFEKHLPIQAQSIVMRYPVDGFDVRQLNLTESGWKAHYDEFSNRWVWPVCHNLLQYAKHSINTFDITGNMNANQFLASENRGRFTSNW